MRIVWFVIFLLVVVAGCSDNASNDSSAEEKVETLKQEIEALEKYSEQYRTQIKEKDEIISELNQELENYISKTSELTNALENQGIVVSTLNEIARTYLPEQYKQAFIKDIRENDSTYTFTVDYASWEYSEDSPNNGVLVNEEEELIEIEIDKDVSFYVLDTVQLTYISSKEFIDTWDENGLYQFFYLGDEVFLVTQVLLP